MKTYAALASAAMRAPLMARKVLGGGEGRPLVAVDEGMVLREALAQARILGRLETSS